MAKVNNVVAELDDLDVGVRGKEGVKEGAGVVDGAGDHDLNVLAGAEAIDAIVAANREPDPLGVGVVVHAVQERVGVARPVLGSGATNGDVVDINVVAARREHLLELAL